MLLHQAPRHNDFIGWICTCSKFTVRKQKVSGIYCTLFMIFTNQGSCCFNLLISYRPRRMFLILPFKRSIKLSHNLSSATKSSCLNCFRTSSANIQMYLLTRGPLVLYRSPESWVYIELELLSMHKQQKQIQSHHKIMVIVKQGSSFEQIWWYLSNPCNIHLARSSAFWFQTNNIFKDCCYTWVWQPYYMWSGTFE